MITFEQFEKFIKPILDYRKEYIETSKALEVLIDDRYAVPKLGSKLLNEYIHLLSFLINDKDECIEYFIFECKCGEEPKKIKFKNKEFILNSIESLYDCLVYLNKI